MKAIDLFAGAGGFAEGARSAGIDVVWAANHWPIAVEAHSANHPDVAHSCQDLCQADFTSVPHHDILLASPACQGHSRARGKDRPHHDATRSTAWAVIACVEAREPAAVVVENVPEFLRWRLYPTWKQALETYGYVVTEQVLDAAEFGVPQNRERLFVVASRGGVVSVASPELEPVPARSFIDVESGSWGPVRKPGRAPRTLRQVEAGWAEFGDEPFLAPYYGSGSGLTGRSLDRPIGMIRTRAAWALVQGDRMRMLTVPEYRAAMGFHEDYVLPGAQAPAIMLLGNAVCPPVAGEVVGQVAARI